MEIVLKKIISKKTVLTNKLSKDAFNKLLLQIAVKK